jgi:basic amino acid/polyamine antiporter, APA family
MEHFSEHCMSETVPMPRRTLSVADAVLIIIGVVIGAGIFKTPALVAAQATSSEGVMLFWLAGGFISLLGALCYAELATAYPDAGGEYHYLTRAFGRSPGFLFAWARMMVIQTGSIAMLAFLVGDYLSQVHHLGSYSSSQYAALIIVLLTAINIAGLHQGKWMQRLLIGTLITGLLFIIGTGVIAPASASPASNVGPAMGGAAALGQAMIFVLLTYGGWNEAAYLSAEVRHNRRNMLRVLLTSIGIITAIYLLVNAVLLKSLGLAAVASSEAVAADLMRLVLGENGVIFISVLIAVAAVSTMNATIITGARTNYALGRDFLLFRALGRWREQGSTPVNALLAQGGIALALVLLGTGTRSGFQTMVEYTAPVFWLFFLLTGISLLVLRWREPGLVRPFQVPLYPFVPLAFCMVCLGMLISSLAYTGRGAMIGVIVLVSGIPLLVLARAWPGYSQDRKEKDG